jgi:pimeloyl-ACP methyl ester carboxylesterase
MKKCNLFILMIGLALTAACTEDESERTYVLVHGAWSGAYAWDKVAPLLEAEGEQVITVELPAHGKDDTPVAQATLQSYVDKVAEAVTAQSGQVILVGHSIGGIVISEVADSIPNKIATLVYLAAYLPQDGQTLLQLSEQDTVSLVGANLDFSEDFSRASIAEDKIVAIFCADCSEADQQSLVERHRAEPTGPLGTPVTLTSRFAQVPKVYIETTQDRAAGNPLQKEMWKAAQVARTYSLNTSHSPFLTVPDELARILLEL